jgi:predicted PhzF superfamily epimerase YddE/YHI9
MGRPSRLSVRVDGGTVSVSGSGHTVAEGRLDLGESGRECRGSAIE